MAKRRVFISFDYDNDRHYKNLLVAWDQNKQFDLSFYDGSVTVPRQQPGRWTHSPCDLSENRRLSPTSLHRR